MTQTHAARLRRKMPTPSIVEETPKRKPYSILHLRLIDPGTRTVNNLGGYTLVYSCHEQGQDVRVDYAFTECSPGDNFNRRTGRNIAWHRYVREAPDWFSSFLLPDLPDMPLEEITVQLGQDVIDVLGEYYNLRKAIVKSFIEDHLVPLYGPRVRDTETDADGVQLFLNERVMTFELIEVAVDGADAETVESVKVLMEGVFGICNAYLQGLSVSKPDSDNEAYEAKEKIRVIAQDTRKALKFLSSKIDTSIWPKL